MGRDHLAEEHDNETDPPFAERAVEAPRTFRPPLRPPARGEALSEHEPRCFRCSYLLIGLGNAGDCPECGEHFFLGDRRTFSRLPPFRFFAYWTPPIVGLALFWFGLSCAFLINNQVNWGLTLAVPATVGFVAGYGFPAGVRAGLVVGAIALMMVTGGLISSHLVGVFCGMILGFLALIPYAFGLAFGLVLRSVMKEQRWYSQRGYLPLIAALLFPGLVELTETTLSKRPAIESQATAIILHASLDEAWNTLVTNGEAVPTGALHAIRLTRPLEQIGARQLGDESTIRFSKGELRVRVTEREPLKRFRFDYVGQSHVEDRAIRLLETTFAYQPQASTETALTIDTRYEPLMTPRWAWRPFERWAGRTTHEFVGREMQRSIDARRASRDQPAG